MTPRNEPDCSQDIAKLTAIEPEAVATLTKLVTELLDADDHTRTEVLKSLVCVSEAICSKGDKEALYCESAALLIDCLLGYFLKVKSSSESSFFHFLNLSNHFPITPETPYYSLMLQSLQPQLSENPGLLQLFNQLQLLYVLCENKDYDNAVKLAVKLEKQVDSSNLQIWVLLQMCRVQILRHTAATTELIRTKLSLIMEVYYSEGSDSAAYFLLRWFTSIPWHDHLALKKTMLQKFYAQIGDKKGMNSAIVLYELFSLEESLIPLGEKLNYQKKLIKFPPSILNSKQLHSLYFFAGSYNAGSQTSFKDSIINYQYSNYFLQKSWDKLLRIAQFMREGLSSDHFQTAMPYWESRISHLNNQINIQNNTYVESLQVDFDKIEELYEKVAELSLTDSLTGLRNRRYLDNNLLQMVILASRHKVPVCFCMIDIDLFKITNDSFGHLAGDFVLKELAKILTNDFRKSDIVVRFGGEEFLMILFDSEGGRSYQMMEELRHSIEIHSFIYRNHTIPTTVSIGVYCDSNQEPSNTDLSKYIAYSDSAMYKAKTSGRNRVVMFKHKLSYAKPKPDKQ